MNEQKSVCPQCHQQVVFVQSAFISTCPACGASFSRADGRVVKDDSGAADTMMSIARAILWVVVAAVAIVGVAAAVIFVGCAMSLGRF
ncbi:MAG: hypothetical protein EPO07_15940 [Verrucomicrobia bacterium]|nr:MAG: hypothetical protein EPO07_15940 [Verrucomicrobiota bacterium]